MTAKTKKAPFNPFAGMKIGTLPKDQVSDESLEKALAHGAAPAAGETWEPNYPIPLIRLGSNVREKIDCESDDFRALVESIRAKGILNPITLQHADGGALLIAGHRRLRAAEAAGLTHVPVIIRKTQGGDDVLIDQLIENVCREDLSPFEVGTACLRLRVAGKSVEWIADHIGGKTVSTIYRYLKLAEWPEECMTLAKQNSDVFTFKRMSQYPDRLVQNPARFLAQLQLDLLTAREEVERKEAERKPKVAAQEGISDDAWGREAGERLRAAIPSDRVTVSRKDGRIRVTLLFEREEDFEAFQAAQPQGEQARVES